MYWYQFFGIFLLQTNPQQVILPRVSSIILTLALRWSILLYLLSDDDDDDDGNLIAENEIP